MTGYFLRKASTARAYRVPIARCRRRDADSHARNPFPPSARAASCAAHLVRASAAAAPTAMAIAFLTLALLGSLARLPLVLG
eukprot:861590-Pleurochrysis_carterae.AAC.1